MKAFQYISSLLIFTLCACGGSSGKESYQDIVNSGIDAISEGDYEAALDHFSDAVNKNPENPSGYSGQGWCLIFMDDLNQSNEAFNTGSTKTDPPADLFAGWGFVLSAKKNYVSSNDKIAQALTKDPSWMLFGKSAHNLGVNDLRVCKAENHYMLGQFSQSLAEVKIINPNFSMSAVASDSDKAALAKEIQRLKGLSKSINS